MTAYRIRVLFEDYTQDSNEEASIKYAEQVKGLLTDLIPFGKVFTYVEANPPADEVEEWKS
jgi:hypothetical protein